MNLWKSVAGMVEVELTGADIPTSLTLINREDIPIFQVQQISDLTAKLWIYRKDYRKLLALCEKRGETLKLSKRPKPTNRKSV